MFRDLDIEFNEAIYEAVAAEIRSGIIKDGLWLKATIEARGDEAVAKAVYARLRVAQFKREARSAAEIAAQEKECKSCDGISSDIRKILTEKKCTATKLTSGYSLNEPDGESKHFTALEELIAYVRANW